MICSFWQSNAITLLSFPLSPVLVTCAAADDEVVRNELRAVRRYARKGRKEALGAAVARLRDKAELFRCPDLVAYAVLVAICFFVCCA